MSWLWIFFYTTITGFRFNNTLSMSGDKPSTKILNLKLYGVERNALSAAASLHNLMLS